MPVFAARPQDIAGRIRFPLIAVLCCIFFAGLILSQLIPSSIWEQASENPSDRSAAIVIIGEDQVSDTVLPVPNSDSDPTTDLDQPRIQGSVRRSATEIPPRPSRRNTKIQVREVKAPRPEDPGPIAPVEVESESPDPDPKENEPEDPEDDEPHPRNLSGWVFDEAGTGVPELVVDAEARRLAPEAVEAAAGAARSATAQTDGEGFFDLPGLIEGEYAVRTESTDRYESASGMYRAGVDSAVLVVSEKTSRRGTVRGFVESADGGSLPGVQAIPVSQFESRVSTDSEGAYLITLALDPRRRAQILRFVLDGFREHRLTVGDAELRADNEVVRNVLLEPLREKTTVTGSVVSGDGSPVHRAHVQLYSASIGRRADGVSDRDGLFSIPDVEHGDDYRLWVRPPSGYKDYLEENLVVTGWVDLDIVVDDVGWSSLEGQMVDPDGRPVPGFTLWLRTASEGTQRVTPVTGDGQGRFFVDQLPEGSAALQTQASPLLTFSGIELAPGVANNVRLRLDTGSHRLGGFVLDAGDGPVAGARVLLLWSVVENGVRSRSKRETISDANGYFLFTMLGSGRHTLNVSADGFRGARLEPDVGFGSEEILIHLGETSS